MKTLCTTLLCTLALLLQTACSEQQPTPTAAPAKALETAQKVADQAEAVNGEQVYVATCSACHDSGLAGAPKIGDKEAWHAHGEHGMEHMLEAVINGKGTMPPRGGNPKLSDADIEAAIEHILSKSR